MTLCLQEYYNGLKTKVSSPGTNYIKGGQEKVALKGKHMAPPETKHLTVQTVFVLVPFISFVYAVCRVP